MASARLRKLAGAAFSKYNLSRRQSPVLIVGRALATKSAPLMNNESETKLDAPLKFTGSKAESWKAQYTRKGTDCEEPQLWYQPWVIFFSLSTFMIYFFILREENDIDRKFDKSIYDHIEGLEEKQIELAIQYNRENGITTAELEARLKELRGQ